MAHSRTPCWTATLSASAATCAPLAEIKRHDGDNVTADTVLGLSVDGYQGTIPLGVRLRRDVYLPLLIALTLIACSPLPVRPAICKSACSTSATARC
jgi:hypothetical protein